MVWQLFLLAAGFQREIRGKHLRFLGQDVSFKLGRFNINIVNEDMSDILINTLCEYLSNCFFSVRGGVKKSGTFGWWGPTTTFGQKGTTFDAEAFKTCKNTIKLINLCALPCLGLLHT